MICNEIQAAVVEGKTRLVGKLVREALNAEVSPERILDEAIVPAMQELTAIFREDDEEIAMVLAGTRAAKQGIDALQASMQDPDALSCGEMIIGTVEGDLHDVGKNLVALAFGTAGFKVTDLGVDISPSRFVNAVKEHPEVKVVCVSALLKTSIPHLGRTVQLLNELPNRRNFIVMIGGGAVTAECVQQFGADFYTADAAEAVMLAKHKIV